MKLLASFGLGASLLCMTAAGIALDMSDLVEKRADASLVGYLGAFFLGNQPKVYFYSSNGNDATSFRALNGGNPVLVPTIGTKGVRDPALVVGGGSEAGEKWYIIGTDLNIETTDWDTSQRKGSLGILVWESTDLINWNGQRLVTVERPKAGMVWAPEAIWDASQGQYLVYWSSKFYAAGDSNHTGEASHSKIRSAYTSDFRTFSAPVDYVSYDFSIIDLTILPLGRNAYARFIKDESAKQVFTETTTGGLHGKWARPAGASAIIESSVEGPTAFWDNVVPGKAHLLLDFYGGSGYAPYESTAVANGQWTKSSASKFSTGLRHGAVLALDQKKYDAINAKWG